MKVQYILAYNSEIRKTEVKLESPHTQFLRESHDSFTQNVSTEVTSLFDFQQLEHRNLLAGDVICTGDLDNVIIVRVSSTDLDLIEIEVDGVIEGTFDNSDSGEISINAELGNDIFLVDYSNGAPVNADGFRFVGGDGVDRLESNNELENFFVFEQQDNSDGSLGEFVRFEDIEELVGGQGQDRFDIRSFEGNVRIDG